MIKWVVIFVVLWAVSGCKSKQKLAVDFRGEENRVEQVEAVEYEEVKRDSTGQKVREAVSYREDEQEIETVVKMTEYDTSKPVVENTGRPPVFRETETVTKQRKGVRGEVVEHVLENGEVVQVQEKQSVVIGRNEERQELDGKVEQKQVRKSGGTLWNWIGLAGVVVVLGVLYLRRRR